MFDAKDSAMKFYRDALGFREFARAEARDGRPDWIALQTPGGSDYIELIPVSGQNSAAELKAQEHLGLASSDVRKPVATLKARASSGSLNSAIAVQTSGGLPARTNIFDPDGARIEIIEPMTTGTPPIASSAPKR